MTRPLHKLQLYLMTEQISQEDCAKAVGLKSRSMLSLIFRGKRIPSRSLAARLSAFSHGTVSVKYLRDFRVPGVNPVDR